MSNWEECILYVKSNRSEYINFSDVTSYKIIHLVSVNGFTDFNQYVVSSLTDKVFEKSMSNMYKTTDYEGDVFLQQVNAKTAHIWYSGGIDFVVLNSDIELDISWIYDAVIFLVNENSLINHETLLNMRYKYLRLPSIRRETETNRRIDLFQTYPEVNLGDITSSSTVENLSIDEVLSRPFPQTISELINELKIAFQFISDNTDPNFRKLLNRLINLSDNLETFEIDPREVKLIQLDIFYAIMGNNIPHPQNQAVIDFAYKIKSNEPSLPYLNWIVDILLTWNYNFGYSFELLGWDSRFVPKQLLLLPELLRRKTLDEYATDFDSLLEDYVKLSIKVLSGQDYYVGTEQLHETLGNIYQKVNDYNSATTYYGYAAEINISMGYFTKAQILYEKSLQADLQHYTELAVSSNFFHYSDRNQEAIILAWSALIRGLSIVQKINELNITPDTSLEKILKYYNHCKRSLLSKISEGEDGMEMVIQLKLDELFNFYNEIANKTIDKSTITEMIEMHQDSLRFMMPQKPPLFLLITSDGKFVHAIEGSEHAIEDISVLHLIAGALTAIRSILDEASMSQKGGVKEISSGDSTLLIEARGEMILVTSAITLDDKLRKFSSTLADEIFDLAGPVFDFWMGDSKSMEPAIELMNFRVLETIE